MSEITQALDYRETDFPIKIDNDKFPRKILGGITLEKNNYSWRALVVIVEESKKYIKLYSWQNRKDEWKVQLCNFKIHGDFMNQIGAHIEVLRERYDI